SMGSELYAYFTIEGQTQSDQLTELAEDAGLSDLPGAENASQVVARLDPEADVRQGAEADLILDTSKIQLFDPDGGKSLTVG
ncbi:MAG: ABC transporter ATP-binding protein, partial [Solirubrobacterales bacterium]|nr:ABC transporter ATP-binding protein [Solirubrobacterales bacterium]